MTLCIHSSQLLPTILQRFLQPDVLILKVEPLHHKLLTDGPAIGTLEWVTASGVDRGSPFKQSCRAAFDTQQ
jgi:hypothetical protein